MGDSDFREKLRSTPPDSSDLQREPGYSDIGAQTPSLGGAAQWGLSALVIGCTMMLLSGILLVFNVLLFRGGPAGIPMAFALTGGLIGALVGSALAVAGLAFGIRGWQRAGAERSSPALGIAGVAASTAGLLAWLIAAADLLIILYSFQR